MAAAVTVTYSGLETREFFGEHWAPGESRVFDRLYLEARGRTGSPADEAAMFVAVFTNNGKTPYLTAEPVLESAPAEDASPLPSSKKSAGAAGSKSKE